MPLSDLPLARITTEQFHAMIQAGIYTEDDKIELIDGLLFKKMSIGSPYAALVNSLNFALVRRLGGRAIVAVQNPVAINEYSEPEPDISLLKLRPDFYRAAHPGPDDVLLVVEVADTSLVSDLNAKMPLYAAAGVPEAWLVNLNESTITVFTGPDGAAYQEAKLFKGDDAVPVPGFSDAVIPLKELGL